MHESKPPARCLLVAGLLCTLAALSVLTPAPADAQDELVQAKPMEITTDTPEYCLHLLDRVSELVRAANAPVAREVTDLTTEGHRMCAHGQTRGGIMRLRSALMIMQKDLPARYR